VSLRRKAYLFLRRENAWKQVTAEKKRMVRPRFVIGLMFKGKGGIGEQSAGNMRGV